MEKKGDVTKKRILESARELFNSKGFRETSISDIVLKSNIQKGSLYFHFQGKDALAIAVVEEARLEFVDFLTKSLRGQNAAEKLVNFFREAVDKHLLTGFVGGCLFGNAALEMSDHDAVFSGLIDKIFDEWIEKIAEIVDEAQKEMRIRHDIAPRHIARHVVATIEGAIMLSRLKKTEAPMETCLSCLIKTLDIRS